MKEMRIWIRY